jgi:hypothetical protein
VEGVGWGCLILLGMPVDNKVNVQLLDSKNLTLPHLHRRLDPSRSPNHQWQMSTPPQLAVDAGLLCCF